MSLGDPVYEAEGVHGLSQLLGLFGVLPMVPLEILANGTNGRANGTIGITIGTNGITNGTIDRTLNDISIPLVPLVKP